MPLDLLYHPAITAFYGVVVSCTNVMEPGSQGLAWGIGQEGVYQGQRTYQNRLRIITTHAYVGPVAIMNFLLGQGVVIGATYVYPIPEFGIGANGLSFLPSETDEGSFLQSVTLEPEGEDGKQWIATLNYDIFCIPHECGTTNIQYCSFDPTDFPYVVQWGTQKYHRYYPTDATGKPFLNAAGDPFQDQPAREESTQILTLINWAGDYDEPFNQTFRDTCNYDEFLGFDQYTVRCKDIDGERVYTADYGYVWKIKYEFEIRVIAIRVPGQQPQYHGWDDLILNAGFNAFGGATGAPGPKAAILINGIPPSQPQVLNQNGTIALPPATVTPAQIAALLGNPNIYLQFFSYPTSIFANLGIPPTILTDNQ